MTRNRCGRCRDIGHNRTKCPYDEVTAFERLVAFNSDLRRRRAARAQADLSRIQELIVSPHTILQERQPVRSLTLPPVITHIPKALITIQDILFDNSSDIPEGLYKQLMDALIIRD